MNKNKNSDYLKRLLVLMLVLILSAAMALLGGCARSSDGPSDSEGEEAAQEQNAQEAAEQNAEENPDQSADAGAGHDIVVLLTSDIHCGVDQNWGLAGLQQIMETLKANGNNVILVDNGDAIQGEPIGLLSDGKAVADLMNDLGYDVMIPGNHEFDRGMDSFFAIAGNSAAPYISCNFMKDGETVFEPYIIVPSGGKKIAFVGVTTPTTLTSSNPKNFQDKDGNFIYSFLQEDKTGKALYDAVQKSVDSARSDGADYVVLLAHLGMNASDKPWDYASVAENTTGINAILDGHSHDFEQVKVSNKDGNTVLRSACGTKMKCIGWLRISAADGSLSTGLYDWTNDASSDELLGFNNDMSRAVASAMETVNQQMSKAVASTPFDLTIYDPEARTDDDQPIRIVRRAETNLGDLITDAFREQTGADAAFVGGGAIRTTIPAGDFTIGDILAVIPFGNELYVSEVTGQQILDALEWGTRKVPNENGGFPQVSGITYEIDTSIESSCKADKNGMFAGVEGEYRVRNVTVGGKPLDTSKKYTLASQDYYIRDMGDGMSMFSEDQIIREGSADIEAVSKYITETLGGVIPEEYADPYGQGRITAVTGKE